MEEEKLKQAESKLALDPKKEEEVKIARNLHDLALKRVALVQQKNATIQSRITLLENLIDKLEGEKTFAIFDVAMTHFVVYMKLIIQLP